MHGGHTVRVKNNGRLVPNLRNLQIQAAAGNRFAGLFQGGLHLAQAVIIGMAEINAEGYVARNSVAGIWADIELPDGGAGTGLKIQADTVYGCDQFGCAHQGIAPGLHGRWAGVGLLPCYRYIEPALTLCALDDADCLVLVLQYGALFDMDFEKCRDIADRCSLITQVANGFQFVAKVFPGAVGHGINLVQVEFTNGHAGTHHGGGKAAAFFVGPDRDLNRAFGLHTKIVQGANNL